MSQKSTYTQPYMMMPKKRSYYNTIKAVKYIMEEGQWERAFQLLETLSITNEKQQEEVDYYQGWYHTEMYQWEKALELLLPWVAKLEVRIDDLSRTEMTYLAFSLYRIGVANINLDLYEEAIHRLPKALKAIERWRLPLPMLQVKVRYSLATSYIAQGLSTPAVQHYELAQEYFEQARQQNEAHKSGRLPVKEEELAHIYHGLCYAYRLQGDLVAAYVVGQKALELYEKLKDDQMIARIENLLGTISVLLSESGNALYHFKEALEAAKNHQGWGTVMTLVNYIGIANLCLANKQLDEAQQYCEQIQALVDQSKDVRLHGLAYLVIGKVHEGRARQAKQAQKEELWMVAMQHFLLAEEHLSGTHSYAEIAEAYGRCAEVLEELGRAREALNHWKSAYKAIATPKGLSWYF